MPSPNMYKQMIWNWTYAKTSCGTTIYKLCKNSDIERQSAKICKQNDSEQHCANFAKIMIKDKNVQQWPGTTNCKKKSSRKTNNWGQFTNTNDMIMNDNLQKKRRSGTTIFELFADGHPIVQCNALNIFLI